MADGLELTRVDAFAVMSQRGKVDFDFIFGLYQRLKLRPYILQGNIIRQAVSLAMASTLLLRTCCQLWP